MATNLINGGPINNGFIQSSNIHVYPCAFRGQEIDQEAKMMTENTISHITSNITTHDAYIIRQYTMGTEQSLEFSIAGYYFKIFGNTADFNAAFSNNPVFAYICIRD